MRLIPLLLLTACATPGEVLSVVEQDRRDRTEADRQAVYAMLRPIVAEQADAIEDLREDNAETFGRALERVQHEALDARQSIESRAARQAALTASERSTARRDSESRDHALTLRLDRHVAQNEGSALSLKGDLKIAQGIATGAGITAGANAGRIASVEKRVEAETRSDAADLARLPGQFDAHRTAVTSLIESKENARTERDDARAAKIEAGIWSTVQKFGTLAILIAGAAVGAWRLLKGRK